MNRDPLAEVQITMKIAELACIVGVLDTFKSIAPPPRDEASARFALRLDEIREKLFQKIREGA